tara:strand:- start:1010 stop:1327 length:318 start_codon:yes stop_codon:yes gene_type:complete
MWLFLSNGFFSVVNHRDLDEHVLIRARRRKHITDTFGDENIYVLKNADYPFRLNLSKGEFVGVLYNYIDDMEYGNFKRSIKNSKFAVMCANVWREIYTAYGDERP